MPSERPQPDRLFPPHACRSEWRSGLRAGLRAILLGKQHIVIRVGIERRIQVDQVNRLVLDIPLEYIQIIPIIKRVHDQIVSAIRK